MDRKKNQLNRKSMKRILLIVLFIFSNCEVKNSNFKEPKLFSKEILSETVESSLTISPTGKELFFVKKDSFYSFAGKSTIYNSKLKNGKWSNPKVASFSGTYSDTGPFISPDGKYLFFTSDRPTDGNKIKKDKDIWILEKIRENWSNPIHIAEINSDKSEYSPSIDNKGNLYFGSYRNGGKGSGDLWVSYYINGSYVTPINLDEAINSQEGEWGSCISPDGDYLVFEASGREENITYDGDLYISYRKDGQWEKAIHLGDLNSGGSDLSPKIHGEYLYFASNRHENRTIEKNNNNVELYMLKWKKLKHYVDKK